MPLHAHSCPFCHENHDTNKALHTHLEQYVGEWRIPADGIHDVLEIRKILHAGDSDYGKQYKCPECSKVIDTQKQFIPHVYYRKHFGKYVNGYERGITGRCQQGSWALPFDEEAALVPQQKGVFNFLGLPYDDHIEKSRPKTHDIRVYLCLWGNRVSETWNCCACRAQSTGNLASEKPKSNPLSLMMANRQIYDEGRRLFYSRNSFVLNSSDIPVFLVAIGRPNAMLLRSVYSEDGPFRMNRMDLIRALWIRVKNDGSRVDIWTDDEACTCLVERLESSFYARHPRRLYRPNVARTPPYTVRQRYNFDVVLGRRNGGLGREIGIGKVSYELYAGM